MNRLNYVLSLLFGMATIALFLLPGSTADAKTCETIKERRCDLKGTAATKSVKYVPDSRDRGTRATCPRGHRPNLS